MTVFEELGVGTKKIALSLAENQEISRLLKYMDSSPLSKEKADWDVYNDNLFNKNIQIKPLLDMSEIEEGFITILVPIGDLNANESFMSLGVQIDIYLPVNSWMINEENLRPYLIMDEIVKKINLKRITSIGTLVFSGFELDTVSDKVTRHSMTFMVDSQNGK